jgi:hypothetical protein
MEMDRAWFPELKLGLRLWEGEFEDQTVCWLRWTDAEGGLIPTGKEAARSERTRAEQERARATLADQRAESAQSLALRERQRAEEATLRAERLADLLRQAGIEP